jgi:signal transduction histidine kinase
MMRAETEETLFQTVTEAASELLGFEYNTVRRYDSESEQLVPVAVSTSLQEASGDRRPYERGDTVQWQAMENDEILVFQNVAEIDDEADRSGDGSMMVIPLRDFGVLSLGSPEPQTIREDDVQLAAVFQANVETAIDRVDRLRILNDQQEQLNRQKKQIMVLNRVLRHNIRNELTKLAGFQTELEKHTRADTNPYVEQSFQCIQHIDSLAETARSIQKVLSGNQHRSRIDLVDVAKRQVQRARETFDTAAVTTEFPAAAITVASERISDGVWELIENAVVHNEADVPKVHVSIHQVQRTSGPYQQLTVSDNGPGLPRQERDVISTGIEHKLKHGSGLGLWYLKWLVDRSEGSLGFVESRFETGTGIQLQLPIPDC